MRSRGERARRCVLVVLLAGLSSLLPAAVPILVVEKVGELAGPTSDSMSQPSDVVATKSGEAWVLDGVNLRLARFSARGDFVAYVSLGRRTERTSAPIIVSPLADLDATTTAPRRSPGATGVPSAPGRRAVSSIFGPPPTSGLPPPLAPEFERPRSPQPVIARPAVPPDRRPVALGIDGTGRLLIGDRYKGAIEIHDASGRQVAAVSIPRDPAERPADPTDVFPAANGQAFWIVDNDNHCLKEVDPAGRLLRRVGRRGIGPGEMHYPATAALAPGGGLLVTDVLNARVDVFDDQGSPGRSIGARGVTPGRFYRPKGVAVDPAGRIHVTDSFTGLVQVFDRQGRLLGIWGDVSGQVHRLRAPTSITTDGAGRFYVVEMLANRAGVWRMRGQP